MVSVPRRGSDKAGPIKEAGRKIARRDGGGRAVYHVTAPAGGKTKIQTLLRASFGRAVDVEEVGLTPTKVLIRQAPAAELDALDAVNIEQEFAAHKALLAKARPVDDVCAMLGLKSRQTLHNWISQDRIIALPDNGRLLLPLWQFQAGTDDKVVAGFSDALRALKRRSFSAAHWFTNPNAQLGNKMPITLLRAGEIDKVVAEAKLADSLS